MLQVLARDPERASKIVDQSAFRMGPGMHNLHDFPARTGGACYTALMARRFNISGMCRPGEHYMLPPLRRLPTVQALIENNAYFVLHAPRQVGKSTALQA